MEPRCTNAKHVKNYHNHGQLINLLTTYDKIVVVWPFHIKNKEQQSQYEIPLDYT